MNSKRKLRWLLILAVLACAFVTSPARADFESAVAAYDQGAYQEAYREFEALADEGDQRAEPYLEKILKIEQAASSERSETPTDPDTSPAARSAPSTEWSWGAEGSGDISIDWSVDVTPWNPLEHRPAPPLGEGIVVPYHAGVWSTLFHLPADATVIVLQHVARIFDARQIYRDLQMIGRNGNKITLGLLAAFWWFMFLRALYGFGQFVRRLAKAAVSSVGEDTYRG